jgi:2'-5' RNA ligase
MILISRGLCGIECGSPQRDSEMNETSALVVLVPEAESTVAQFRQRYDPAAARGMPAHITLLYPFKDPEQIDPVVLLELGNLFARFDSFSFTMKGTGRFPGVLFLQPEPREPFDAMIKAIMRRYPEHLPYGGAVQDPHPHLTVADVAQKATLLGVTEEFDRAAGGKLPIHSRVSEVSLMATREGFWHQRHGFRLR